MPLPAQFPILETHAPRPERLREALNLLREKIGVGAMRKAEHEEIRMILGRSIEKAWENSVSSPYFHVGKYAGQSEEANRLHRECNHTSLHDMISTRRKLQKSSCDDPPVRAMRALADEVYPLAEVMAEMRGNLIAGRAAPVGASAPAVPDATNQIRGTCSCCFRSIAVLDTGKMAHHGYQRPGLGVQTSSCAGIRFEPLESSVEGLEWLIGHTRDQIGRSETALAGKDGLEKLAILERRGRLTLPRTVEKAHPDFPAALRAWERDHRMTISACESSLAMLGEALTTWQVWHQERAAEPPAP